MHEPFWGLLVVGLLLGAGLVRTAPRLVDQWERWRRPGVEIHPAVAVQGSTLRLTNQDSFEWTNVGLVLNDCELDGGYTCHLARLPEGTRVELALASFTIRDRYPFDPRTTKAFHVSLQRKIPQRWGTWSGRLDEALPNERLLHSPPLSQRWGLRPRCAEPSGVDG